MVWDDSFDLSLPANQERMLTFCSELRDFEIVFRSAGTNEQDVSCFMENFKSFAESQSSAKVFPVPQNSFETVLQEYYSNSTIGQMQRQTNMIGIDDKGRLRFVQV